MWHNFSNKVPTLPKIISWSYWNFNRVFHFRAVESYKISKDKKIKNSCDKNVKVTKIRTSTYIFVTNFGEHTLKQIRYELTDRGNFIFPLSTFISFPLKKTRLNWKSSSYKIQHIKLFLLRNLFFLRLNYFWKFPKKITLSVLNCGYDYVFFRLLS